jgi:hypothetical protein
LAIRNHIFKLVGTAFFVAGFYLLIESQWVYAAVCFMIGLWYFVQSVRKDAIGKGYRRHGDGEHQSDDGSDHSAGDSYDSGDSGDSGGGGGDD